MLTNVMVFSPQMCRDDQVEGFTDGKQLVPFLGPIDLAPGQAEPYAGCVFVPYNTCEVTVFVTSQETCRGTWITNTASCPVAVTPGITLAEVCPSKARCPRVVPWSSEDWSATPATSP